ncbi:hypothetical protein [Natrinema soli]|uniref:hypothetical protein n=1 Tax=Natrinema soli TaxID=1930624 RepID=UPI002360E729|nr:hypothetical protein [Natrinema soli]
MNQRTNMVTWTTSGTESIERYRRRGNVQNPPIAKTMQRRIASRVAISECGATVAEAIGDSPSVAVKNSTIICEEGTRILGRLIGY